MSKDLAKLAEKIAVISTELGKVEQDGENRHDHYRFISHEQMTTQLRGLLAKHKLVIFPSVVSYEEKNTTTATGKQSIRTIVTMQFTIVDTETGFSIVQTFTGADQDLKGKSMGQAITEAVKRFELKLFHVTSKDEIDPDSRGETVTPKKKTGKEIKAEEERKAALRKEIGNLISGNDELRKKATDLKKGKETKDLSVSELSNIVEELKNEQKNNQ